MHIGNQRSPMWNYNQSRKRERILVFFYPSHFKYVKHIFYGFQLKLKLCQSDLSDSLGCCTLFTNYPQISMIYNPGLFPAYTTGPRWGRCGSPWWSWTRSQSSPDLGHWWLVAEVKTSRWSEYWLLRLPPAWKPHLWLISKEWKVLPFLGKGLLSGRAARILNENTVFHSDGAKALSECRTPVRAPCSWSARDLPIHQSAAELTLQFRELKTQPTVPFSGMIHWHFPFLPLNKAFILKLSINTVPLPDMRTIFLRRNSHFFKELVWTDIAAFSLIDNFTLHAPKPCHMYLKSAVSTLCVFICEEETFIPAIFFSDRICP